MDLITRHWDDLLRLAGSLKLGLVRATAIMRTLQVGDRLASAGRCRVRAHREDPPSSVDDG